MWKIEERMDDVGDFIVGNRSEMRELKRLEKRRRESR